MKKKRFIKIISIFIITLFVLYRVFLGLITIKEECVSNKYIYDRLDYSHDSVFVGKVKDIFEIKRVGFFNLESYKDVYLYEMDVIEALEGTYNESLPLIVTVPNNRINIKNSSFCNRDSLDEDSYYLIIALYSAEEDNKSSTDERTAGYDHYSSFIELIDYDPTKTFEEQFGPIEEYFKSEY